MSTSAYSISDQTSGSGSGSSWSEAVESIFSYNGNAMLASIISLLLVILFVLLLHLYAKWFLSQSRRRRRRSSLSVTHVLGPNPLYHFHTFSLDSDWPTSKGLDASVIASIPLFVFCSEEHAEVYQECVICLGGYDDGDIGRCLGKCGHAFHVECIDMWLQSHSSCPICRSPAVPEIDDLAVDATASSNASLEIVIDSIADQDRSMDETSPDGESDGCAVSIPTTPSSSCSCPCLTQFPVPATGLGSSLKRMMSCTTKSEWRIHPLAI